MMSMEGGYFTVRYCEVTTIRRTIMISGAFVFPPPPFCSNADWLLPAAVRELPRAL